MGHGSKFVENSSEINESLDTSTDLYGCVSPEVVLPSTVSRKKSVIEFFFF